IYAMLTEANPTLPLMDERRWVKTARYAAREFHRSFQAFTLDREELVAVLRPLPEDSWSRACTIEGRTHNVFSQFRRIALHESEHCDQLEALRKIIPTAP